MKPRRLHRIIGVVMLLPMLAWAATGLIFFIKPGYSGAYEILNIRTYPLGEGLSITPDPAWLEFRCVRTVLGEHLMVRTGTGRLHLDPKNMQPRGLPSAEETARLLSDALTHNPARYGRIIGISQGVARTDTGIEIRLDWERLTLQQRGRDTDRIDRLYKVHYLQLTGIESLDRVVGLAGLLLLVALTVLGAGLAIKRS